MVVELMPEIEALIQRRLASGAFSSAEEVIERALEFLTAEETWLAENRDLIASRIQEGWDEAQRGELTDDEDVRAEMQRFKDHWKKQRQTASPFTAAAGEDGSARCGSARTVQALSGRLSKGKM